MTQLYDLNKQWSSRPNDQRFLTLEELRSFVAARKEDSWTSPIPTRDITVLPAADNRLTFAVPDIARGERRELQTTHWSFGQLASYASAPAGYLRKLPPQLAAINLAYGLERLASNEDCLVLANNDGSMQAITSQSYGRIWDIEVVNAVMRVNQDGRWQIPAASYSAANPRRATTLYASDRDVWMFLCDPTNPVEVNGESLFRGFMVWNSEVGAATFGLKTFLYRRVCDNRIVWGVSGVQELNIRHTGGAPERFAYEGQNLLRRYAEESTARIAETVTRAQSLRIDNDGDKAGDENVVDWLQRRGFTSAISKAAVSVANEEEGQASSLWDIVQGLTAHARSIPNTDDRVELETKAGKLLAVVGG